MRVAVLSDSHIDHGVHGFDAADAWSAATEWILEHGVELVVVAGDMFHSGRTAGVPMNLAGDTFAACSKAGMPVVVLAGNHEWIGARPAGTGKCLPIETFDNYKLVKVVRTPRFIRLPGSDLALAAIPWPEPGNGAEAVERAAAALAGKALAHDGPRIAVAHAAVEGTTVSTVRGTEDLWRYAAEPVVRLDKIDIPEAFGHTALGHVHGRQALSDTCGYVGSTEAISFKDEGEIKGFSVFTWDDSRGRWDEDLVPVGVRSFLTVDVDGDPDVDDQLLGLVEGTLVRLRLGDNADSGTLASVRADVRSAGGRIVDTVHAKQAAADDDDGLDSFLECDDDLAHTDMNLSDLMDRWYDHTGVPDQDRPPVDALLEEVQAEM